jgi:hypothetical protein
MLVRDEIETTNKREFGIEQINGQKQLQTSRLVVYGDPSSYSAMAKTVGIPTSIATLSNTFKQKGVIAPMTSDIYTPILKKLKQYGIKIIKFQESVQVNKSTTARHVLLAT